ncbi:MAG: prepilin-type N-terminal cleavage/methylation domain-containing protein [Helicobacteraceae bacterium]|nr:prepilin-type N-terminal cleavage/methylation domain-containing protein [Helicobacteraceae bacterium]
MKRSGFTMIELIFVIVILGILAAVAIPKLSATRDDAKIAKGATELATAISDMGSYYTSQGSFGPVTSMTNVIFGGVELNASGGATYEDCITITSSGANNTDLNVTYTTGQSAVCTGIAMAAVGITGATSDATISKAHSFGGSSIQY